MLRTNSVLSAGRLPLVYPTPAIVHMQAYANGLTSFIPTLFAILDLVSREMVGFANSVERDANAERAAVGELIKWHKSGKFTLQDIAPSMTIPTPADRTPGEDTMAITKSKFVDFGINGEEQRGLANSVGVQALYNSEFAQALRALTNAVELDLAVEAATHGSRAAGIAGTTPFASGIGESAAVRKILDDNGAPGGGRSLIINSAAGMNYRSLNQLAKVNESGTEMTLRDGELMNLHGMSLKESGQLLGFTKGTNSGATTNNAGYAVGATVITLASAGTGTIKAGDIITFAGDTNKYQVKTGDADVSNGGSITLCEPGLLVAIPAATTAITTGASYLPNVAFSSDAMRLLARAPAKPAEGDARIDEYLLTDTRSGITYEVSVWAGNRMVSYQVGLSWGVKAVKEPHIALMLG